MYVYEMYNHIRHQEKNEKCLVYLFFNYLKNLFSQVRPCWWTWTTRVSFFLPLAESISTLLCCSEVFSFCCMTTLCLCWRIQFRPPSMVRSLFRDFVAAFMRPDKVCFALDFCNTVIETLHMFGRILEVHSRYKKAI